MNLLNIILMIVVLVLGIAIVIYFLTKRKNEEVETVVDVDDKTYTIEKMTEFVKKS